MKLISIFFLYIYFLILFYLKTKKNESPQMKFSWSSQVHVVLLNNDVFNLKIYLQAQYSKLYVIKR